ncbi:UDP-N-acetylglucosamine--dolichyl-phosphate N-acetylglucosaminephosphotransferase [Modicella reniformis]|uniref:UDP-N-acetylglucosamine--dolichyl-phosphate N-acetylglucosaminephosphotransferase n=1 Tax=Modicella reniformis TaxID=1440133 RepID=A0A9P6MES3_9FUNG|nr:UDP-N-acetylglucosamine--dolichyl-phosphate N-acetylglucosaminephosphotransferase [Modicella reniformis]
MGQISALTAWLILAAEIGAVFIILTTAHDPLTVNLGFSILAGITAWSAIPALSEIFVKAGLKGMDLSKKSKQIIDGNPQELALLTFPNLKLAELLSALLSIQSMVFLGFADDVLDIRWRFKMPLPAIAAIPLLMVYWVHSGVTFIVVPIPLRPFLGQLIDLGKQLIYKAHQLPVHENNASSHCLVEWPSELGPLYYVYMSMVAIFCTHSINIMAGINGVEVGQSLVIACSIAINDILFLQSDKSGAPAIETHLFSLYFILPFIGVSLGLLVHNWYPSKVFIGDTYCYFAGMTFAVVGILAHYSKTLLLFFIPQIFNFLLSSPQLFRLVPCPRHRVPRYNRGTNLMEPSRVVLDQEALDAESFYVSSQHASEQKLGLQRQNSLGKSASSVSLSPPTIDTTDQSGPLGRPPSPSLPSAPRKLQYMTVPPSSQPNRLGWLCIKSFEALRLTHVRYDVKTGQRPLEMTNLTILNLILLKAGPMSERNLTISVMIVQVVCSLIAFFIRYRLVYFVYDVVS